jgi:ABC-type Fe3+/spermidine/putrescine transport system ATPase subunit
VRPERLRVERRDAAAGKAERGWTTIEGRVNQGTYLGDQTEYRILTDSAGELVVRRQNVAGAGSGEGLGPGDPVRVSWHEEANLVLVS